MYIPPSAIAPGYGGLVLATHGKSAIGAPSPPPGQPVLFKPGASGGVIIRKLNLQEQVPKWLSPKEKHRRPAGACAAATTP
jgi:hypothetical protein